MLDRPAFADWFGASKVVDEQGKPMVVYHGTATKFESFRGPSYFTASRGQAADYAANQAQASGLARVMPVYLSLQNPQLVSDDYIEWAGYEPAEIAKAKAAGFDGFINEAKTEIVAFRPEHIQSATSHSNDFSREKPVIGCASTTDQPDAFKRWFGDSKVVGADGKPLVVYHGTQKDFDSFANRDDWESSLGHHFGSVEQANKRIFHPRFHQSLQDSRLMPVFLAIENPLKTSDAGTWQNPYSAWLFIQKGLGNKKPDPVDFFNAYGPPPTTHPPDGPAGSQMPSARWRATVREKIIDQLLDMGYDGIRYKNRIEGRGESWIALRPQQIKSALSNTGLYSRDNPDITDRTLAAGKALDFLRTQKKKTTPFP